MNKISFVILFFTLINAIVWSQETYKIESDDLPAQENGSFVNRKPHELVRIPTDIEFAKKPKNIILLIGDGMGSNQVYAAITANGGQLNMMQMPFTGYSITKSADDYITDSGAGGTALSTGKKTYNGAIAVDTDTANIETILEIAERNGLKTGLISTSAITHATPASFIAHQKDRELYEEIAADFLKTDIDLFIGGGQVHFEKRVDKRNLSHELRLKGYQIENKLDRITDPQKPFGVFTSPAHNASYPRRGDILPEATELALSGLSSADKGFFLMVEGSQIDWGGHANDTKFVVNEVLDFDRAIGKALEFAAKDKNTLVIVTADHETGGMALIGGSFEKHSVEANFIYTDHTGCMVPVFAFGPGAEKFTGIYQNTEIFNKMMMLYGF